MDIRITVDFTGGTLKYLRSGTLGEPEHIYRSVDTGLDGLRRIFLIVYRTCRTGEIVYLIHFDKKRKSHIVPDKLETRLIQQMVDVAAAAGVEVIDTDDLISPFQQLFAKPGAEKTASSCYQYPAHGITFSGWA
jgi:hypothetical protein